MVGCLLASYSFFVIQLVAVFGRRPGRLPNFGVPACSVFCWDTD